MIKYFSILGFLFFTLPNLYALDISFSGIKDFGKVEIGSTKTQVITIKNRRRRGKIRIDEFWFTDDAFTKTGGTCRENEYILKKGQSCTYSITFSPKSERDYYAEFHIGYYRRRNWTWRELKTTLSGEGTVSAPVPTPIPTSVPTPMPTAVPTSIPTPLPTAVPTSIPTPIPTAVPTVNPNPAGHAFVSGNKIYTALGQVLRLKGVNIADPEHLNLKDNERPGISAQWVVDKAVNEFHAQVIRITVHPGDPNYPTEGWFSEINGGEKYFNNHVKPLVDDLTSKGIYSIIDLHYVSDWSGLYPRVKEFWTYMAPKYKDNPYVIYEIFNEPIYPDNWNSWKDEIAQPAVNLIRSLAPDNLIIVGGPFWSSHMSGAATNPVQGNNIIYTAHVYSNQSASDWERNFGPTMRKFPMFVTEWGFETGSNQGGTQSGFGVPFVKWMDDNQLSWTAWCFDSLWGPRMFDSNWNLLTGNGGMGDYVRDLLR